HKMLEKRFTILPYTTLFRSSKLHLAHRLRGHRDAGAARSHRPQRHAIRRVTLVPSPPAYFDLTLPALGRQAGSSWDECSTTCARSEEHTSELQSRENLVCRL